MTQHRMIRLSWFSLIILFTSCGVGRNTSFSPHRKFSPEQMRNDFSILRTIYEKSHPGIYWYTSKDSMDYFFNKGFESLNDSMTEPQFKNILSTTIQHIECGHSSTKYSKKYEDYLYKSRFIQLPLQLKVLNDSLVYLFGSNPKDSLLHRGDIIKSINDIPAKNIIDTIANTISTDGVSMNFKYQQISNSFPYYYRSVFNVSKEYKIDYINKDGAETTAVIKPYNPFRDSTRKKDLLPSLRKTRREIKSERKERTFSYTIDTALSLAWFNVNNFSSSLKKHKLKNAFKDIRRMHIKNMAVDLRLNGGGLINKSIYLARYLKAEPFRFMDSVIAVRKKLTYPKYIKQRFLYNLGLWWFAKKTADGNYQFRYYENKTYSLKEKNHFGGNVYLVTGGNTFSAASLFTSSLKGQPNVKVVGEETGGGYYGNNGVFIPDIILPNTFIRVRLPLFRIVNNIQHPKDGRGVIPDIEVAPTLQTIIKNVDPKLEKIKAFIRQQQ